MYVFYGHLVYFTAIRYIILSLGIFYGQLVYVSHDQLVYFMAIWHILWPFGIFYGQLVYQFGTFSPFRHAEARIIRPT
jgi:hypothetical protein